MRPIALLFPAAGVVLIAAVLIEVFLTVFDPVAIGGPLTRRQNRFIWWVFTRMVGRRTGYRRHRWLAFAAPLMAVITLFNWALLTTLGFALIYRPWIETFVSSTGRVRASWAEALYLSASTVTTLGLGDLVPDLVPLRFALTAEAFTGFAFLTAGIGYILAIAQSGRAMSTLALNVAIRFEGRDTPGAVAGRLDEREQATAWGQWSEQVGRALLDTWLAQTRYPILHYFHPVDERQALPVQLARLVDLDRETQHHDAGHPAAAHPGFIALCRSVDLYLRAVEEHVLPHQPADRRPGAHRPVRDIQRALARYLGYS